jgi:class 3 adenylate cyclase/predicted ATPase
MFCDVMGFTRMSSRLDPEDLSGIVRGYQDRVATTIARFGGFIARYVGDGVLIYFGWPEAHEASAERAVRAALAIVQAIQQSPIEGEHIKVRIGIATGLVVIGEPIGRGDSRQQTAIGETPNLAARLQGLAEPDGIIIDAMTRRQIGSLFDCRDLGVVTLKGLSEPVQASLVLQEAEVESRFMAFHTDTMAPLVGRDEELKFLLQRWQQAKGGAGQLVLISGEPGIGKSRLIAAMEEQLRSEPHEELRYFCSPHYQDSALYPIVSRWERDLKFDRSDTSQEKFCKLETVLLSLGMSPEDVALIADLLLVPADYRYPQPDLDPQRKKEKTFDVLLRALTSRARLQPVLMLFEDAHWADPSSLELLDKVVGLLDDLPILTLISFRPEYHPKWIGLGTTSLIVLQRLTHGQTVQIAERILIERTISSDLLERIVAQTDGVPLFIEELTKAVLEDTRHSGSNTAPLEIPATLQASLVARLDRLPTAKQIAQIGAVIGREFTHALLVAVANVPQTQLTNGIEMLVQSGLAFQRGTPPDAAYMFKHALVRDAAYSTLLRTQRQQLHARIAIELEQRFPDVVGAKPELVAHHFTECQHFLKAIRYWRQAGQLAVLRSANAEAVAHFSRGAELTQSLPVGLDRNQQEFGLLLELGPAIRASKGQGASDTLRVYSRARELFSDQTTIKEKVAVLFGLCSVQFIRGEHLAAVQVARQSLELVARQDDREASAFANRMMGLTSWVTGMFEQAEYHLEQVVAPYRLGDVSATDPRYSADHLVWALSVLAMVLYPLGYPERAAATARLAVDIAHPTGQAMAIGFAYMWKLTLDRLAPMEEQNLELANEALSYCREHKLVGFIPAAQFYKGQALVQQGDLLGIDLMHEAIQGTEAISFRFLLPTLLGQLASVLAEFGNPELALDLLSQAIQRAEETREGHFSAELYRLRGELLLERGETEKSFTDFEKALSISRAQRSRMWELRAATGLARYWADRGLVATARDLLAPVFGWFTEGHSTLDLRRAKALLEELH